MQKEKLQKILEDHKKWVNSNGEEGKRADLSRANLYSADLRGANLGGANLSCAKLIGAHLCRANLCRANLYSADLYCANLEGANLFEVNLSDADLYCANLEGANLAGADLAGADLKCATMPDGKKWEEYLKKSVPELLTAGGKKLKDVATKKHWECHDWDNCPMAAAFDVHDLVDIPEKYQKDAATFIALFDARMIPMPKV